ncbi:RagB/SusD family nutrient uptake outer membrane protein [Winogradskyella sp.]|uniref:RagB/SusD family nutrient uptake outer membrane protein n=1 Tax=Winogradskyella sp. TaxID=1883156 RepID=UPI003BA9CEB0
MNRLNFKIIAVLLILMLGVNFMACDVDVVQEDTITSLDLSETDVIDIARNVKNVLKWQSSNSPSANSHTIPHIFQDLRGGNAVSERDPVNWITGRDFNQFSTITPSQQSVQALWSKWFKGINRANTAIKNLEGFTDFSDESLRANLIAQSKFFRALFYFELAKHFGAVPLRLEAVESLEDAVVLPRANSVEDVYSQIVSDLNEALPNLASNPSEKYEATQGAAYALLAKVSLYNNDYQSAIDNANLVTGYTLEDDFVDNFRLSTEGNRSETILEVPFTSGQSGLGFETAEETSEIIGSGLWQMFAGISGVNTGWNNLVPTIEFVESFADGDERKLGTLVVGGEPQEGLTADDTSILSALFPSGAIQRKIYLTPSETQDLLDTGNTQQCDVNDIVLRYADVLLIKAEAQIMLNGAGAGDDALNQIAVRAGLGTSTGYTLEDLKYHRRAELSFEGYDRFTDLVRWGDAATVLAARGFSTGRDEYLPIPQLQIDQSAGLVEQNPGY